MPLEMVRAGKHGGAAAVEFKAVKGPAPGASSYHRPAPEAPLRVTGPVNSSVPRHDRPGWASSRTEPSHRRTGNPGRRRARSRLRRRRDGADMPVGPRWSRSRQQGTIRAQRSPVHLASQDVDPQQLLPLLVPARALAQQAGTADHTFTSATVMRWILDATVPCWPGFTGHRAHLCIVTPGLACPPHPQGVMTAATGLG
jgi:hypothetical protein